MNHRIVTLALAASGASVITAGAAVAHSTASPSPQRFTFSGKTLRGKDLPITVSATGPISGKGTVRIVERPKTSTASFHFSNGNLQVLFVHGRTSAHPDPAKCRATIDSRGTYTIRGGTRQYAGATGKGAYAETRLLLGARSTAGKCLGGPNATPEMITAVATMRGTVSLR
jgi:hypothetical protein